MCHGFAVRRNGHFDRRRSASRSFTRLSGRNRIKASERPSLSRLSNRPTRAIGDSPECLSFHSWFSLHPVDYLRAKDNFEIRPTPVDVSTIY